MVRTALIFALFAPTPPPCPAQPQRAVLGAVITNPDYQERVVEVCGTFRGARRDEPRERILYEASKYQYYAVYVLESEAALPRDGTNGCIVGTYRRRDGLTAAEAELRGQSDYPLVDIALARPDWVFYPIRCTYDGPALG